VTEANYHVPEGYRARFRKVLEYIDAHLAEELSVERLGRVAAFSKYHFHRQFSALFGLSVHEYVQLVRLKHATDQLGLRSWRSVLEVALDSGYESPEAFARAFKKQLGRTPSEFQRLPDWRSFDAAYRPVQQVRSEYMLRTYTLADVQLVQFEPTRVAAFEHRGDPQLIRESIRRFIEWRRKVGLTPAVSATYNIFWANPEVVPPHEYRMDLCAGTTQDIAPNDLGVVDKVIPGGRCARLRHVGPDPLHHTIHFLYMNWLPGSGENPRDFPLFAQRVAFPPRVPEHESIVDVYLPVQ
jgi:AraC family transcriptional regulator